MDTTQPPGETGGVIQAARLAAITEFCSAITHDINQPISAVITNAHTALRWLSRPTPDLEEVRLALERITRDADRTRMVIAQAGAQLTQARPAVKPCDINRLMRETLALMNGDADRARVRVETALDSTLLAVVADPALLQQVAIDLISNALDAMSEVRGRTRVLHLSSRREGADEIAVSIADTGVGLGPDGPQQVFQHFFTTKARGLGLGLPISRSVIEGCGGRLTAEPNHPHGAVFTFTLPVVGIAP
jgi:C4-dicarboxylate-specific signal transduction histidine kinase